MAKLQINYTNVLQSIRLLKMGVPAWSADCTQEKEQGGSFWQHKWIKHEWNNDYNAKDYQKFLDREKDTLPCWSVGRLIEIMAICYKWDFLSCASFRIYATDIIGHNLINQLINDLSLEISRGKIDFSKLED